MKRNSYVHCSFDLVESFKPRVPKTRVIGKFVSEEAETPRICTADTIQHVPKGRLHPVKEDWIPELVKRDCYK